MRIVIEIPKEFEEHFKSDRFEDSLQRVRFDIHKSIIGNKNVLSGKYEIETLDMLTEAFLNGTPLPEHHGDLIDRKELKKEVYTMTEWNGDVHRIIYETSVDDAPTIIEEVKADE